MSVGELHCKSTGLIQPDDRPGDRTQEPCPFPDCARTRHKQQGCEGAEQQYRWCDQQVPCKGSHRTPFCSHTGVVLSGCPAWCSGRGQAPNPLI